MILQLPDNVVIFGSYFPAWILCVFGGLIATILGHMILVRTAMLAAVPLVPIFYLLFWLSGSMAIWLAFFTEG